MQNILIPSVVLTLCSFTGVAVTSAQDTLPQREGTGPAAAPGRLGSDDVHRQQVSYALGLNIGGDLRSNEIEVDLQYLVTGIRDALEEAEPRWSEAEMEAALARFHQQMQQKFHRRMEQQSAQNRQQAEQFLAANGQREGVETTASGLQYKILEQGDGPSPTLDDTVRCHYRGVLLDGTEFDSSYRRGQAAEFPVGGVISGWTEALQKMRVGDKWQLFVPADLAYGDEPPGPPIGPGSLLVFEIELLGIVEQ